MSVSFLLDASTIGIFNTEVRLHLSWHLPRLQKLVSFLQPTCQISEFIELEITRPSTVRFCAPVTSVKQLFFQSFQLCYEYSFPSQKQSQFDSASLNQPQIVSSKKSQTLNFAGSVRIVSYASNSISKAFQYLRLWEI